MKNKITPSMILIGTLLATIILTGCGQSGPLYLPKDKPATAPATTLPQPATK
jgi:predicted small lipoprotein YifL